MLLAFALAEPAAAALRAGRACDGVVFRDWSDNGRVDGVYPLSCYRAAIAGLPADVRDYSDAPTEIERALAVAANRSGLPRVHATERDGAPTSRAPIALVALGATVVLLGAAAAVAPLTRRRRGSAAADQPRR